MVLFQAHAEYNQMREMVHHYQAKLAQVRPTLIGPTSSQWEPPKQC
jgi:hypothetical protein